MKTLIKVDFFAVFSNCSLTLYSCSPHPTITSVSWPLVSRLHIEYAVHILFARHPVRFPIHLAASDSVRALGDNGMKQNSSLYPNVSTHWDKHLFII